MEQIRIKRQPQKKKEEEAPEAEANDIRDPELDQATDDLLDEIDSVLEENADDFVMNFIQRGGE